VPLRWHVKRKSLSPETAKWGLYSVAVRPLEVMAEIQALGRGLTRRTENDQVHQQRGVVGPR
jgi:hypothetical protein